MVAAISPSYSNKRQASLLFSPGGKHQTSLRKKRPWCGPPNSSHRILKREVLKRDVRKPTMFTTSSANILKWNWHSFLAQRGRDGCTVWGHGLDHCSGAKGFPYVCTISATVNEVKTVNDASILIGRWIYSQGPCEMSPRLPGVWGPHLENRRPGICQATSLSDAWRGDKSQRLLTPEFLCSDPSGLQPTLSSL